MVYSLNWVGTLNDQFERTSLSRDRVVTSFIIVVAIVSFDIKIILITCRVVPNEIIITILSRQFIIIIGPIWKHGLIGLIIKHLETHGALWIIRAEVVIYWEFSYRFVIAYDSVLKSGVLRCVNRKYRCRAIFHCSDQNWRGLCGDSCWVGASHGQIEGWIAVLILIRIQCYFARCRIKAYNIRAWCWTYRICKSQRAAWIIRKIIKNSYWWCSQYLIS